MTTEFGHFHGIGGGICFDAWGAGPFVIEVGGKRWRFEDSDRFGPCFVKRNGEAARTEPGERSPFWRAHAAWRFQGRKVAADGQTCLWSPLRPTVFRKIGGRHANVIMHGDEGGGYLDADTPEGRSALLYFAKEPRP